MFTGLVEEVGTVRSARRTGNAARLVVGCQTILRDLREGDSVSIEGACQTVVTIDAGGFVVDTLAESLRKTTLGSLGPGSPVNLERALRVGDRLGGHIVQGHVDGTGTIRSIEQDRTNIYVHVELPPELHRYCIAEGSIAIGGISLTIARLSARGVVVNVIPETWKRTSLRYRRVHDRVNIEADVLSRYVERLITTGHTTTPPAAAAPAHTAPEGTLSAASLAAWGYGG